MGKNFNNCIIDYLDDNEEGKKNLKFLMKNYFKTSIKYINVEHNNIDNSTIIYFQNYYGIKNYFIIAIILKMKVA